ncbi:MAG: hypothetical protein ABIF77_09300 [bacterium]
MAADTANVRVPPLQLPEVGRREQTVGFARERSGVHVFQEEAPAQDVLERHARGFLDMDRESLLLGLPLPDMTGGRHQHPRLQQKELAVREMVGSLGREGSGGEKNGNFARSCQ